jgi:imidazole glycerol phosphate synthase glutamine amidotransferase subunit
MSIAVGVVDYGMGNLHSVEKALALNGARVTVSNDPAKLDASDLLVLPGVGSFGAAMNNLKKSGLDKFVINWINQGRPYLGICLGFQLLFEASEESPHVKGLGVFKGRVIAFKPKDLKGADRQIPHMGWNTIAPAQKKSAFLTGFKKDDAFYFVHTFYPVPADKKIVLTTTPYGKNFCSAIAQGNVVATQFHPEKSGDMGLKLLKNILANALKARAKVAA